MSFLYVKSSLTNHTLWFHILILSSLWCYHLLAPESLFSRYCHNIYHNTRHEVSVQWVFVDWFTANGSATFSRRQCRLLTSPLGSFLLFTCAIRQWWWLAPKESMSMEMLGMPFHRLIMPSAHRAKNMLYINIVELNLHFSLPYMRFMYMQNLFQGSMKHKLNRTVILASTSVD